MREKRELILINRLLDLWNFRLLEEVKPSKDFFNLKIQISKFLIMAKLKLRGKHLQKIGYPQSSLIGLAINICQKEYKRNSTNEVLEILKKVVESPKEYVDDRILGQLLEV